MPSVALDDRYHCGIRFAPRHARLLRRQGDGWSTAVLHLSGVHGGIELVRHATELDGFVDVRFYPPARFVPLGNVLRLGRVRGPTARRGHAGPCTPIPRPCRCQSLPTPV
jgi:hypothetical protein